MKHRFTQSVLKDKSGDANDDFVFIGDEEPKERIKT
jgi:hypothetical protein